MFFAVMSLTTFFIMAGVAADENEASNAHSSFVREDL